MSSIDTLRTELTDDPLTRGYSGMDDAAAAAADLNTAYRTRTIDTLTAAEIYEQIDTAEFDALSIADKATVDRILGLGGDISLTPSSKARATLLAVFDGEAGTDTRPALAASVSAGISRAVQLGLGGVVKVGHVQEARRI